MAEAFSQMLRVAILADSVALREQIRNLLTEAKILVTAESDLSSALMMDFSVYMADVILAAILEDSQQQSLLNQLLITLDLPVVPYIHIPNQPVDLGLIREIREAASENPGIAAQLEEEALATLDDPSGLVIHYEDEEEEGAVTARLPASPVVTSQHPSQHPSQHATLAATSAKPDKPDENEKKCVTQSARAPGYWLKQAIMEDDEDLQATQASSHYSQSVSFDVNAADVDIQMLQTGETRAVVEWNIGSVVLDMYEIIGLLGEGAMGLVHRVFHRGWNMDLAVKTPRLEELQKAGAENFEREAETWVNLGLHPNIVSCYYVRRVGNVPRVFAEYINGGSLNDWIRQGKLTRLPQILDIMIQFAWGLHHAHSQGFVHQDVKPANVMLTLDGVAKVTDFGLTKGQSLAVGSGLSEDYDESNSLVTVGGLTPAYCSPEQVNEMPLNYKADIWSWGVSVLEIFVGRLTWPFGPMAMEVLEGYLEKGPARPGIELMPPEVVALLRHCFQPKPADRPSDLLTVARELQKVYTRLTGQAYPRPEPKQGVFTADTLNNRAVSLVDLGKLKDANQLWEQALSIQPHHPESTYNQGLLLWRSGRLADDGLLAELAAAEQSYPHACLYQYLRGLIHLERVDGAAAMDALNSIPKNDSRREALENVLTAARARLGRAHWAISEYDQEHLAPVSGLALDAQGERILSCSHDGRLKLWNVATGHCYKTIQAHQRQLYAIAVQSSFTIALSAGEDSTIKIWDMQAGVQTGLLAGHTHSVYSLVLSADGTHAVSGGEQAEVRIWDVPGSRCIGVLSGHKGDVLAVGITPDLQFVISGGADQLLRVWAVKTGRCLYALPGHEQAITALAVCEDGRTVLSGSADTTVRLWDIVAGTCLKVMYGNQGIVTAVAIKQKGLYAISAGQDKTLRLWELKTGRCFHTYQNDQPLLSAALSYNGHFVITGDKAWKIKRWDVDLFHEPYLSPMVLSQVHTSENVITALQHYEAALAEATNSITQNNFVGAVQALRKARSQKGYGRGQAALVLWRQLYRRFPRVEFFASWEMLEFNTKNELITVAQLNAEGTILLTGSNDGQLKLWSVAEGTCLQVLRGHSARVNALAWSQDGVLAISASQNSAKVWNVNTGECLFDLVGHQDVVSAVQISWNRRLAVTASHDKSLLNWELERGRCLGNLGWHTSHINAIALSMDSQYLVSGGGGGLGQQDYSVYLWDMAKQRRIASYSGHGGNVLAVQLNHKTTHIFSAGRDRLIKLWDIVTGECIRDFVGHEGSVHSLCLSWDDRFLLSGDSYHQMKLWEVSSGFCLHTFSGQYQGLRQVILSEDASYIVVVGDSVRLLMMDWILRERDWQDWDDGALPWVLMFLNRHTPYLSNWAVDKIDHRQISLALTQRGQPVWNESDLQQLLWQLGCAGFGWLKPEGVQKKLTQLAHYWRQTIKVDDVGVTCPQCKASKQHKPRCLECGYLLSDVETPLKKNINSLPGAADEKTVVDQAATVVKHKKTSSAKKIETSAAAQSQRIQGKKAPKHKQSSKAGILASDWMLSVSKSMGILLRIASVIIVGVLIARYMRWL